MDDKFWSFWHKDIQSDYSYYKQLSQPDYMYINIVNLNFSHLMQF